MSAPLFKAEWWLRPQSERDEAHDQFKAVVVTARTSPDESVKQVLDFGCALAPVLVHGSRF